jgi:hypothetical protein
VNSFQFFHKTKKNGDKVPMLYLGFSEQIETILHSDSAYLISSQKEFNIPKSGQNKAFLPKSNVKYTMIMLSITLMVRLMQKLPIKLEMFLKKDILDLLSMEEMRLKKFQML